MHKVAREFSKWTCKMSNGSARSDLVGAEPIRFRLALTVWQIQAEM